MDVVPLDGDSRQMNNVLYIPNRTVNDWTLPIRRDFRNGIASKAVALTAGLSGSPRC